MITQLSDVTVNQLVSAKSLVIKKLLTATFELRMEEEKVKSKRFELKIIHAGFHRGGTASAALALDILGYGPVWHMMTIDVSLIKKGMEYWLKDDCKIFKTLDNDNWNDIIDFDEWLQIIKCSTIMDVPTVLFWDKIFKQYPNCKVIVPCFEFEKWYPSMLKMTNIIYSRPFTFASYLLSGAKMTQQLYMPRLFNNNVEKFLNDKQWANNYYDQRLQEIQEIVPKDQLLIYDVREGWEPLCKFLDKPVPNEPFPRINGRQGLKKLVYRLIIKGIIIQGIFGKSMGYMFVAMLLYYIYKYYSRSN